MKKIAIVTVVLNFKQGIEKTIESVFRQNYNNIEYIIQDGGSIDGTIQIAKEYEKKFALKGIKYSIYVEKDKGIYDAMNKAISKINSDYVIFLNAGDYLAKENTLFDVAKEIENGFADIVYGNYYNYSGNVRKRVISADVKDIEKKMICTHQAIFTKCELIKKRPYDIKYKMVADYDFYIQMYLENKVFRKINTEIVYFEVNGYSQRKARSTQLEKLEIRHKYGCLSNFEYRFKEIISIYICLKKVVVRLAPKKMRFRNYEIFTS